MREQISDFSLALLKVVGKEGLILSQSDMQPYLTSWRDNWVGKCRAVVRPSSTEAVSAVVKVCAERGVGIVPQGGRTGVTGASQPHDDMSEIVLSLERMNRIRSVNVGNDTMTVDAGCIIENVRTEAARVGRLFPLRFGSVGSCMIGGNISTNAGGVNVVRYGNIRSLVAGLEVVRPDGRIWDGLRGLRKGNAGYDLKQIVIGAEGTLGIITAAVLRLVPKPIGEATAFIAVQSPAHALQVLSRCRLAFSEQFTAFELIQRYCLDVVKAQLPEVKLGQATVSPWYVLIEVAGQERDEDLKRRLEEVIGAAFGKEE